MGQAWFRERYGNVYTLIVNNFSEPSETPEHNALQARFLEDGFCVAVAAVLGWDEVVKTKMFIQRRMDRAVYGVIALAEAELRILEKRAGELCEAAAIVPDLAKISRELGNTR